MKLSITVDTNQASLSHAQLSMIRRMMSVMREHGFNTDLTFTVADMEEIDKLYQPIHNTPYER
jgi:hypothetical protein